MRHPLIEAAIAFAPRIRRAADELDRSQRIPADLLDEMTDAGLFRLYVPRSMGGEECAPLTVFHVVEQIAQADGSMGWLVMIGAETSLFSGWLAPELGRAILGSDEEGGPHGRMAGSSRPEGVATRVADGYRASGRWDFGSGILHATCVIGTCQLLDAEGEPVMRRDGRDELISVIVPVGDVRIDETWDPMGLRGTGSHDFVIEDLFVPEARCIVLRDPAQGVGPQWTPEFHPVSAWVANAGQSLGMARGAIEAFRALAQTTASTLSPVLLRDREPSRLALAQAEAIVSAARSFVLEAVGAAWEAILRGDVDRDLIARARLADVHAVHESVRAIELLYRAAGTNAIHRGGALERVFRDAHVARQHGAGMDANYDLAGQQMLGMEPRLSR